MTQNTPTSIVLVQPFLADRQAYEAGQKAGRIFGYLIVAIIILWLVGKLLRR